MGFADVLGSHVEMWLMILIVITLVFFLIYFASSQGLGQTELPNIW